VADLVLPPERIGSQGILKTLEAGEVQALRGEEEAVGEEHERDDSETMQWVHKSASRSHRSVVEWFDARSRGVAGCPFAFELTAVVP
jgi:hypothetical protein